MRPSAADFMAPEPQRETAVCRFSLISKPDPEETLKQGRPVFKMVEYIDIMNPGDKTNLVSRPITEKDKARFARQYEHWKRTGEETVDGIPLEQWPAINAAQVDELRHFGIRSVEALAGTSDTSLKNMGPFVALRQRARDYLEHVNGAAPLLKLRAELEESQNQVATLSRQLREQAEDLAMLKARVMDGDDAKGKASGKGR